VKVAILGFGIEGRSAYTYWSEKGADITVCDQNTGVQLPTDVQTHLGDDYLTGLDAYDVVCRTASINPGTILAASPGIADKITTVINEFLRVCPTKNTIGVTGTKGKGTTSTLITRMLEAAGKQVFLGGNIGRSPLEFLPDITPDSWVVLELSSYQLSDIKYSPHIAVGLMISPEHLTWHDDLEDYIDAKTNLFRHQAPHDVAIYYAENETSHQMASVSPGAKISYYAPPGAYIQDASVVIDETPLCKTDELRLLGRHNWQNVCAAVTAVWQVTQDAEAIRSVLTTFSGLPHRLEFVREFEGVLFYNDSFASAPPAATAAIEAIPGPKVLIMGGYDRLLPLQDLAASVKAHEAEVSNVLLIGASAQRTSEALASVGYTNYFISSARTMQEVVTDARRLAEPGNAIILSPAFPSFDMFKNFEDRGEQFKQVVNAL
jgi:UDP-N-acetylmuramoylalanine--D-glutamate ligase